MEKPLPIYKNSISKDDIDDDVRDTWAEELAFIKKKFMPWQREIMITGFIVLVVLLIFLGYANGVAKVCGQAGGVLDWQLQCHLKPQPITSQANPLGNEVDYIGMGIG